MKNPKILHRVYCDDLPPFEDPFLHFLQTWSDEMPDYEIKKWNTSNIDTNANEWMRRASAAKSPVFMSEYARWAALKQFGGMYLDADCEILNGAKLHGLIEELYASDEYDAFIGVEEKANGHPTAQTIAAKPDSELVKFMLDMYDQRLSSSLWHWREERGFIGPQLMSLYFREHGQHMNKGFFCNLEEPMVFARVKVYTQDYFSPKFTIAGDSLFKTKNTCVYHLFANLNVDDMHAEGKMLRQKPLRFDEYETYMKERHEKLQAKRAELRQEHEQQESELLSGPPSQLEMFGGVRGSSGEISYTRALRFALFNPIETLRVIKNKLKA